MKKVMLSVNKIITSTIIPSNMKFFIEKKLKPISNHLAAVWLVLQIKKTKKYNKHKNWQSSVTSRVFKTSKFKQIIDNSGTGTSS